MKLDFRKLPQLLAGVSVLVLWTGLTYGFSGQRDALDMERSLVDLQVRVSQLERYAPAAQQANSRRNTCISNLKQVESAKEQWAMVYKMGAQDTASSEDLVGTPSTGFLKKFPQCPIGGRYTIGSMSVRPTCSRGESDAHYLY